MQFLTIAIILTFGFGPAGLVSLTLSPHWLWLIPSYCLGTLVGLAVIWLTYAFPTRGQDVPASGPSAGEPVQNRS